MRTIATMDAETQNPVATLFADLKLKLDEFAEHLGCSKGHAHDLCTGRRPVTAKIARRLETLSGKPWHEWMATPDDAAADQTTDAAA